MTGRNHRATRRVIDEALITGTQARAFCGMLITPKLRVGSGGKVDKPGAARCEVCDLLDSARTRATEVAVTG